jgi:hypothetical protein
VSDRRKEASIRSGVVGGTRVGDPLDADRWCHPHGVECLRRRLSGRSKDTRGSMAGSVVESGARWRSGGTRRGSPGGCGAEQRRGQRRWYDHS